LADLSKSENVLVDRTQMNKKSKNFTGFTHSTVLEVSAEEHAAFLAMFQENGIIWTPEEGGSMFLRNVGAKLKQHKLFEPGRLRSEQFSL
jgi:hypothetical protein